MGVHARFDGVVYVLVERVRRERDDPVSLMVNFTRQFSPVSPAQQPSASVINVTVPPGGDIHMSFFLPGVLTAAALQRIRPQS